MKYVIAHYDIINIHYDNHLGASRAAELIPAHHPFNVNDADQPWWTPMTSYETGRKRFLLLDVQ